MRLNASILVSIVKTHGEASKKPSKRNQLLTLILLFVVIKGSKLTTTLIPYVYYLFNEYIKIYLYQKRLQKQNILHKRR